MIESSSDAYNKKFLVLRMSSPPHVALPTAGPASPARLGFNHVLDSTDLQMTQSAS